MAISEAGKARRKRWRDKQGTKKRYGKKPSLFEAGNFVAVDGEGFNAGAVIDRMVGADNRIYRTQDHEYAFLSASDGSELYNRTGRLATKQCLDFLLDIKRRDPTAILVCFGAGYDMCHMLAFGLDRDDLKALIQGTGLGTAFGRKTLDISLTGDGETHDYRIELRNRKSLSIWRWPHGADKFEEKRKKDGSKAWVSTCVDKAVLWDVWGFFQGSFIEAMDTWLPSDPDYLFIKREKGNRNIFVRSEIDTIRRYNAAELRCLVAMMEKVRQAIRDMGLTITRWDGAGAIAGAMLKEYGIKEHMAASPPEVFEAARYAYSGGHIEACKIGYYNGLVHHYDVNSAYPDQFRNLPSLALGYWKHSSKTADNTRVPFGFTLVRVEYRFTPGLPFYPLFYRQTNGSIIYPERGHGWYWFPEFEAATAFVSAFGAIEFRVVEWWHFHTHTNERPFMWIEEKYQQRKAIVEESKRTGIPNGAEKTLKLGYNSVYGKAAQQVGARLVEGEIKPPAYFQLEWAGYVTSGCRAKLMTAAIQKPHAIISFATDGLFATQPLDLYCPKEKELGAWEYQVHQGMTMVMPGVYWLHEEKKVKGYSRGFDKHTMKEPDFVHQAWKQRKTDLAVPSRRLITLGSSLMSDDFWDMRGCFVETTRSLALNGDNSKRCEISYTTASPHKWMVATQPRDLLEDYDTPLSGLMSAPYPIAWLDLETDPDAAPDDINAVTDADRSFYIDALSARDA